ncbi:MAG: helix-turn-helix domain-containing protein [Nitrospirota bacterium]
MSKKEVLLISSKDNKSLHKFIEKNFKTDGFDVTITFFGSPYFPEIIKKSISSLIIIEADVDGMKNVEDIEVRENNDKCIVIASEELIKRNIHQIKGMSRGEEFPSESKECQHIEDFVDKKLKNFVKKMKDCKGKNIYSMLIKEFEKPLITFILKETNGNKTQAAHLLGINRNTLTKKIKELNLSIK